MTLLSPRLPAYVRVMFAVSHSPGIGAGHAVVGAAAFALQRIASIYHPLAGDGEVPQSVVFLLDAGVRHRCNTVYSWNETNIRVSWHRILATKNDVYLL